MSSPAATANTIDLSAANAHFNLSTTELVEHALRNGESLLAANGALVSRTGKYTRNENRFFR